MPDHQRFDMRKGERLAQQRICIEINLTDREVVRGAPVGVELPPLVESKAALPLPVGSGGTGKSRGETGTFIVQHLSATLVGPAMCRSCVRHFEPLAIKPASAYPRTTSLDAGP